MKTGRPFLDRSVPVLLVRIGRYPHHHGAVGAIRTLGRTGVPVHVVTEDPYTPAARSRYTTEYIVWPTTGQETDEEMLTRLLGIGRRIGTRSITIGTDDEAAVFLSEHARDLDEWFINPAQPPALARQLASKKGLYDLCRKLDVATPRSFFASGGDEIGRVGHDATFPVVVKNVEPWVRLTAPAVPGTTMVLDAAELSRLARTWPEGARVVVQEFIPHERSEDWILQMCTGRDGEPLVTYTGRKIRSWPPHAGQTSYAKVESNPALAEEAGRLCGSLGYRGIADMCWRLDERDGQLKLLDFNPRLGAQFEMFRTDKGIDVVRALHLDLTGKPVPRGRQNDGHVFVVESLDIPARFAYRRERRGASPNAEPVHTKRRLVRKVGLAWLALDDLLPPLFVFLRFARVRLLRLMNLR